MIKKKKHSSGFNRESWGGAFCAAFPYTIPVLTGYLFLGTAFGILLASKGFHWGWALFMSVFIYAGSMQFVAVNLLTYGANLPSVILMTIMVNIRHVFYGLSMLKVFEGMGRLKPYMIFSLTDETFSLLCSAKAPEGISKKRFLFAISLLNHCYWVAGSLFGSIVGGLISFDGGGIDFVMTALFITIFLDQWNKTKNHVAAVAGLIASLVCLLILGPDGFILPAMFLITGTLLFMKKRRVKK